MRQQAPTENTRLSVIIPTLNEAQCLAQCLQAIKQQVAHGFEVEIVIADGGSEDDTRRIAETEGVSQFLATSAGRGGQLHAGAEVASGAIYMFLHADVVLPPDAFQCIRQTLPLQSTEATARAGAFQVKHVSSVNAGQITKRLIQLADRRSRHTQLPYGDQAVFVLASTYQAIGGMPVQPLMEDLEFARRITQHGRIAIVPKEVCVSARRFEQRPWRTVLCWWTFPTLYRWGVSPQRLMRWYGTSTSALK